MNTFLHSNLDVILSNKLDLNQETHFTILVYRDGFRT